MAKNKIIILFVFFLVSCLNAQDNISGCFEFKLIEFLDAEGKPMTGETKDRFVCLYDDMICFDTLVTVTIPMFSSLDNPMRIVYNRKTKIQYIFRSDSLGNFVTIDSSYFLGIKAVEDIKAGFIATDSVKIILGFECTRYLSQPENPSKVKYEKYIASDVIGWSGVKAEDRDFALPMILETRSIYPDINAWNTLNGAVQFIKPADPQLLSLDLSGYKIITQEEWMKMHCSK